MSRKENFILKCGRENTYKRFQFKHFKYYINTNGCWICTSHAGGKDGYPRVREGNKLTNASRIVYKFYKGDIFDNNIILHSCDNPKCINPEHLIQGTHKDNSDDKINKNRHIKGSKSKNSKLKKVDVLNIIKLKNKNMHVLDIATKYNISESTVRSILNGRNWNWLTNIVKK